jgi:N-acyl-L-homoserine lactone synthetase
MYIDQSPRLLTAAASEFTVQAADTPFLLREAYKLRHQVYCVERGFEASNGSDVEMDEFDDHAPHVVLRRNTDGQVVGTARLVLPRPEDDDYGLPMYRICGDEMAPRVPLTRCGEVSRFAVSKERRGLSNEGTALIRLGLVQGLVMLSRRHHVTHWCAVMERSLLRLLRSTSIHFDPVGSMVEYHGLRQPAVASIDAVLDRMERECPHFWNYVTCGGRYASAPAASPAFASPGFVSPVSVPRPVLPLAA